MPTHAVKTKKYTVSATQNAAKTFADIDEMFNELYREIKSLQTQIDSGDIASSSTGGTTLAQVSARVLHEL